MITKVDRHVLDIADRATMRNEEQYSSDYAALLDIMKAYGCSMDKAATMLVNARLAQAQAEVG